MRSASGYGNGRSNTASTIVAIALAAPMPIANVRTAAMVKARCLKRVRIEMRRSAVRRARRGSRGSRGADACLAQWPHGRRQCLRVEELADRRAEGLVGGRTLG